jgi:uncharacterized integral membrane protein
MTTQKSGPVVHQGHFGEFTINQSDRRGIIIYRMGLVISALSFITGSFLVLWQGATPFILQILTPLFAVFSLGLAISIITTRIYFIFLHRLLQIFWLMGTVSMTVLIWQNPKPLALLIYDDSLALFATCFSFATLTGIYLKETFCYQQVEAILLTILVPTIFVGHVNGLFSLSTERGLLIVWMILFLIFIGRKVVQPLAPDIGDKSVFTYLEQRRLSKKVEKK